MPKGGFRVGTNWEEKEAELLKPLDGYYNPPVKLCRTCGCKKPLTAFVSDPRKKTKRGGLCRDCSTDKSRKYTRVRRVLILEHYSGGIPKCACCGEATIEFLSLDHINGGGGQHRRIVGQRMDQWIWANKLPDGFRVLCHNCNQALGNYDYCPHQSGISEYGEDVEAPIRYMKLNPLQVEEIRRRIFSGELQKNLAIEFGVSRALICLIVNQKEWKNGGSL